VFATPQQDVINKQVNADELYETLRRAISIFNNNKEIWNKIIENAMEADNRWGRSLGHYTNVDAWLSTSRSPAHINSSNGIVQFFPQH